MNDAIELNESRTMQNLFLKNANQVVGSRKECVKCLFKFVVLLEVVCRVLTQIIIVDKLATDKHSYAD